MNAQDDRLKFSKHAISLLKSAIKNYPELRSEIISLIKSLLAEVEK